MAAVHNAGQPQEVADKVLRRAQVSKMTRALQDRLALANIKIKHGWQHRSIDSIEPEIENELKRKRSDSNSDMRSDTCSIVSGRCFSTDLPASTPLTAAAYSEDVWRSGSSYGSAKKFKMKPAPKWPASASRLRGRSEATRPVARSWKAAHGLPQSSPVSHHKRTHLSLADLHNPSFTSETSTIMDSSSISEDDDHDLPLHSFQLPSNSHIPSSPPRTPPSSNFTRSSRMQSRGFDSSPSSSHTNGGKEGADLLLLLAASPSPAMRVTRTPMFPPSTPPAKTPLPSSMMSTPGGRTLYGFDPNTPSVPFNFADFLNVTPSPAQGPWSRTPAIPKTPLAAREARRRLNFDALLSHTSGSPNIGIADRGKKSQERGLGMELGGEL